ncbi:hypothetical protein HMN09_00089900 [Mycena chlorophos]|uniref:Uncharacterized protein n=1 Tax=Mycena chlorophos TaxID=658473 RepID=A0A8H6TQ39_MYCCL|nr:hypothetical protein HMN09_00089900 [Mycena chlorophos]
MYAHHNLDSPPPPSQFRRPWSPDPYDPLPSTSQSRFVNQGYAQDQDYQPDYGYGYNYPYGTSAAPRRQREASEVSMEALDLADYAMTLRAHPQNNAYPGSSRDAFYPPSPPAHRPLASPPSAVSRMDTLSSNTHSSSARAGRTPRRPYSLPPPSVNSHSSRRSQPTSPRSAASRNYPYGSGSRQPPRASDPEIDIAHFPAFSRTWYNNKPGATSPPDRYTALPPSSWNNRRAPMDLDAHDMFRPDARPQSVDPYDPYSHPASSLGHESTRDLLPWSSEPPDYGPSIDASLKEERIRMLEREFGPNANKSSGLSASNGEFLDEDGKPLVGTVNSKGQLVTKGPKKRLALRITQVILSLAAMIPGIYAALLIKPTTKPPPSGTVAAYVLYIFSSLTVLLMLYMFAIRPCCCAGKRRKPTNGPGGHPMANGMMVMPVSGLPGGKKPKKPKKGKKGMQMPGGLGDVQVNLIVDPNAFGRQEDDLDDTDEELDEAGMPGTYDPEAARRKRKRAKRRSVFAGLAMEEAWKMARSWLKKVTAVDVLGLILWGGVFIFILIGKRCPSGQFDGWCNAYNTSTAAGCLLAVSFGVGIFFDVQDLAGSKLSPRTRT